MKSVPVAPRLEFRHKDGSTYLLISTSFNRLLLQRHLNINESSRTAQSSRDGSSRPQVSCKKGVLRNFTKFTRTPLPEPLF